MQFSPKWITLLELYMCGSCGHNFVLHCALIIRWYHIFGMKIWFQTSLRKSRIFLLKSWKQEAIFQSSNSEVRHALFYIRFLTVIFNFYISNFTILYVYRDYNDVLYMTIYILFPRTSRLSCYKVWHMTQSVFETKIIILYRFWFYNVLFSLFPTF